MGSHTDSDTDAFAQAVSQLTAAFGDATRRSIFLRCRSGEGGVTAAEIAREFELHANVARHHLDKLVEGGYLLAETARTEAAGRPSKRYRATNKDVMLSFPTRRDDLLAMLLARALESLDPEEAAVLAERVGYDYGLTVAREMSPRGGTASFQRALQVVGNALNSHGFEATVRPEGRWHATITAAHCPFGDAARSHPHLVCALDRGMVRGMLAGLHGDCLPETTASLPEGDTVCVTRV